MTMRGDRARHRRRDHPLDVANDGNVPVSRARRRRRGAVCRECERPRALPVPPCPSRCATLMTRVKKYERATIASALSGSARDRVDALALNPLAVAPLPRIASPGWPHGAGHVVKRITVATLRASHAAPARSIARWACSGHGDQHHQHGRRRAVPDHPVHDRGDERPAHHLRMGGRGACWRSPMAWSTRSSAPRCPAAAADTSICAKRTGRSVSGRLMAFLFIFQTILVAPLSVAGGAVGFADYLKFFWTGMTPLTHHLIGGRRLRGHDGAALARHRVDRPAERS